MMANGSNDDAVMTTCDHQHQQVTALTSIS